MKKYNLQFISDKDLFNHVKNTVDKYRFSIDLKTFNKHLIDPIKLTFDTLVYNKNIRTIIENEVIRQLDKSNTNHIGYFHQNIFQYLGDKWTVPAQGFDIINEKENIFVELKNKHNTMNSSSAQKTYSIMQDKILHNDEATCMLVEVIAGKSQNITWQVSMNGIRMAHKKIRRVSIDKFYEFVTGDSLAFKKLCKVLPIVIKDVIKTLESPQIENSVFKELTELSPDILESLYILAFSEYEGFKELNRENA